MKKDVLIDIKGIYRQDGEQDQVELVTTGSYYKRNGDNYIDYEETEMTGFHGTHTVLRVELSQRVSQLIIERGVRHQCHYDTGYGAMTIGVSGDRVFSDLDDHGGKLQFSYSLDVNTSLASENEVFINVRESAGAPVLPVGQ